MSTTIQLTPIEKELLRALDYHYGTAMQLRNRLMSWLQNEFGRSVIYLDVVQKALTKLCQSGLVTVCYIEDDKIFEIAASEARVAELLA